MEITLTEIWANLTDNEITTQDCINNILDNYQEKQQSMASGVKLISYSKE